MRKPRAPVFFGTKEASAGCGSDGRMQKKESIELWANAPNLITLGRMVLVPAVVAAIASRFWTLAFALFLIAGLSDALDGWLAKRFDLRTELGAYLDPLADKALLASIYASLAWEGIAPVSLAVLVVFRDVMIVGAVMVSWLLQKPVRIRPLFISKANTAAQIVFAAAVLGAESFAIGLTSWFDIGLYGVAALTLASLAAYLSRWLSHMNA
jgi:cardiolipin synthase